MGTYRLEAGFEIDAPPERVWESMARPADWGGAWPVRPARGALRLRTFPPDLVEWRLQGRVAGTAVWRLEEVGTATVCRCTATVALPDAGAAGGALTRLAAQRHARALTRAVRATAASLGAPARKVSCTPLDRGLLREAAGVLAVLWVLRRGHAQAG